MFVQKGLYTLAHTHAEHLSSRTDCTVLGVFFCLSLRLFDMTFDFGNIFLGSKLMCRLLTFKSMLSNDHIVLSTLRPIWITHCTHRMTKQPQSHMKCYFFFVLILLILLTRHGFVFVFDSVFFFFAQNIVQHIRVDAVCAAHMESTPQTSNANPHRLSQL